MNKAFSLTALIFIFALTVFAQQSQVASTTNSGELITLRGKRIYVEISGPKDAPALLYLHGGPGASSYDFGFYQGKNLSKDFHLILMDQRGVLRSDPIGENEPFSFDDIIADAEALRVQLGIKKWSIIGHSFGGYVALHYAAIHPESIEKVIFENPSFDFGLSARSVLRGAAKEYQAMGKPAEVNKISAVLKDTSISTKDLWENDFTMLTNALGDRRDRLYFHNDPTVFNKLIAGSNLPDEMWHRGWGTHQKKLYAEGKVYTSLVPELSKIQCPSLLIIGKYDHVTGDEQIKDFKQKVKRGKVVVFENSGHFAHIEEPEKYAQVVTDFLKKYQRSKV